MAEPNILLTRVDNRLIHGQVGVTWVSSLGANLILVANDDVANDSVQQNLMDMVVSEGVQTRYFSLQKTIDIIHKASSSQKIFIVLRTPQDALTLIKGGVPIKELNIGNMHFSEGKERLTNFISVSEDDKKAIKELNDLGIAMDIRQVPTESKKNIMDLLK